MKSGMIISSNKKNSFMPNNFENEFLSEEEQQSNRQYYKKSQKSQQNKNSNKNDNNIPLLKNGQIDIKYVQHKINEQKAIKKVNNNISKISASLNQLKKQYQDVQMSQLMSYKRNQKKQQEIKQFLKKKHLEKRQRQKKLKQIKERQERRRQQALIMLEQSQLKKLVRKNDISYDEKKARRNKQKQQKDKIVKEFYQKYKDYKRYHQIKEEQDQIKQQEQLQEFKQFLHENRQKYKPIDEQQLEQHQRKHQEMLRNLQKLKQAEKQQKHLKIIEQNNKLQQKVFRGHTYEIVQGEQQQKKLKKMQPKKRYSKMKKYEQYVRQNFIPRTYQQSKSASDSIDQLQNSNVTSRSYVKVKRMRYIKGINFGEIIQKRSLPKTQAEQKKIGNGYLEYMHSLPKKQKASNPQLLNFSSGDIQILDEKMNAKRKIKRQRNPLYNIAKRKSLDLKLSAKPTRDEVNMVLAKLKNNDQKVKLRQKVVKSERYGNIQTFENKRNQINQGLIDNIERKLMLLGQL